MAPGRAGVIKNQALKTLSGPSHILSLKSTGRDQRTNPIASLRKTTERFPVKTIRRELTGGSDFTTGSDVDSSCIDMSRLF